MAAGLKDTDMEVRDALRGAARAWLHPSLKQVPWRIRWAQQTNAYKASRILTVLRTGVWTFRELTGRDLSFGLDGAVFTTPPNNMIGMFAYVERSFDPGIFRFVRKCIGPGAAVCDVGANIGIYTVLCSRMVGDSGTLVAFEADPRTFRYLEHNVRTNGCTNATLVSCAVGKEAGYVCLEWDTENSSATHVTDAPAKAAPVPMIALDAALPERGIERLDYLKIDVEGYELNVLAGARRLIINSPNIMIQTEVDRHHLGRYGFSAADLEAFLHELGFTAWQIGPHGECAAQGLPEKFGDVIWTRAKL